MPLLSQSRSPLTPRETTTVLIIYHFGFVLPVLELHKNGTKQNVLLSGRFLSFSKMFLRFVSLPIAIPFWLLSSTPLVFSYGWSVFTIRNEADSLPLPLPNSHLCASTLSLKWINPKKKEKKRNEAAVSPLFCFHCPSFSAPVPPPVLVPEGTWDVWVKWWELFLSHRVVVWRKVR